MNHGWKILIGVLIGISISIFLHQQLSTAPVVSRAPAEIPEPALTRKALPQAELAIVTVPPNRQVQVAQSESTASVQQFAQQSQALAAINAGFFDPVNQKTTSYITIASKTVADPTQTKQLCTESA